MFDFLFDAIGLLLPEKALAVLSVGCFGFILLAAVVYFSVRFGFSLGS